MPQHWTHEEDHLLQLAVRKFQGRRWKEIACEVPGRNEGQCLQRWSKTLKPGIVRGKWSVEEDQRLVDLVRELGMDWGNISDSIPGRTSKQCRQRWRFQLDPMLRHGPFSPEEDAILEQMYLELGSKWSKIAAAITGRTADAVKVRWKSITRKRKRDEKLEQAYSDGRLPTFPLNRKREKREEPTLSPQLATRMMAKPKKPSTCRRTTNLYISTTAVPPFVPASFPSRNLSAARAVSEESTNAPSLEFGIKSINALLDACEIEDNLKPYKSSPLSLSPSGCSPANAHVLDLLDLLGQAKGKHPGGKEPTVGEADIMGVLDEITASSPTLSLDLDEDADAASPFPSDPQSVFP